MTAAIVEPVRVFFGDCPVTAVPFRGAWVWRADEVGVAAGYKQGRRLVASIHTDWREDFREGRDFDILRGELLAEFKRLCTPGVQSRAVDRTPSLVVLYESGLNLALLLAGTETGRRLRRLLAEHVLPQLLRTGRVVLPGAPEDPEVERLRAENERLRARVELLSLDGIAGVIGLDRAEKDIVAPLEKVAELHPKGLASGRRCYANKLRNAIEFNGSGTAWAKLPRQKLARAEMEIGKLYAEALKAAKERGQKPCGGASTCPVVVQLSFSFALDLTVRRAS